MALFFKRWANSVLKEYLLKGYVLNQDRTLITNENYIELVHRVNNIDNRLSKFESDNYIDNEKIFFDGEWFDARSFIKDIFTRAKEEIILIDPYAETKKKQPHCFVSLERTDEIAKKAFDEMISTLKQKCID